MTRIGRCRVRPDNLASNASYGETNLAPLKISRSTSVESINYANVRLAALLECIPEWHLIHKAFSEIAVARQTKFKDADAIANAIGCGLSLKYVSI